MTCVTERLSLAQLDRLPGLQPSRRGVHGTPGCPASVMTIARTSPMDAGTTHTPPYGRSFLPTLSGVRFAGSPFPTPYTSAGLLTVKVTLLLAPGTHPPANVLWASMGFPAVPSASQLEALKSHSRITPQPLAWKKHTMAPKTPGSCSAAAVVSKAELLLNSPIAPPSCLSSISDHQR